MWRVGIGNQQHVAFVDRRPAADRRAVHAEAFFEGIFGQLVDGIGNVLPQSGQVGEAQIEHLGSVFLGELQNGLCISHWLLLCKSERRPDVLSRTRSGTLSGGRILSLGRSEETASLLQSYQRSCSDSNESKMSARTG